MSREALAAALGQEIVALDRIPGGDLNDAYLAGLADGTPVFVKTARDAAPGAYAAEAAGLDWLRAADALPVPQVLAIGETFIALEWVEGGGAPDPAALGRGLAAVHRAGAAKAGELPGDPGRDFVLGPLTLPNAPRDDWPAFYAESRLLPLARQARDRGALDAPGLAAIEDVAARIDDLAGPPEPIARLHGDLWSGNVHGDVDGRPWLIDPAAYGGHREVDLAMLQLFGGVGGTGWVGRALDAYDEVWPRADGHADRVDLYQLLPLLVHAVLFGGSYGASAHRAAERVRSRHGQDHG